MLFTHQGPAINIETDDSPFYSVSEVCHLELDARALTTDSQLENIITDDESDLEKKAFDSFYFCIQVSHDQSKRR